MLLGLTVNGLVAEVENSPSQEAETQGQAREEKHRNPEPRRLGEVRWGLGVHFGTMPAEPLHEEEEQDARYHDKEEALVRGKLGDPLRLIPCEDLNQTVREQNPAGRYRAVGKGYPEPSRAPQSRAQAGLGWR